jgi:hypothetical protein
VGFRQICCLFPSCFDVLVHSVRIGEPGCEGFVISIAQIAAGRMYIEARKLPSISYASGDLNQYPLVS